MNSFHFDSLVHEMCDHVGIADWQAVVRARAVDLDDSRVALVYDEAVSPHMLTLVQDKGELLEHSLLIYLLCENASRLDPAEGDGYFAMDPATGSILYLESFIFDDQPGGGARLAQKIVTSQAAGSRRFERACELHAQARDRIRKELKLDVPAGSEA